MAARRTFITRSALGGSILGLAAAGLSAGAGAAPPTASIAAPNPNRLEARFIEGPPLSRTADCTAEPRICQAVLKGEGSLDGFGAATEIAGLSQDRAVTPCGPGSDSEVYTRRIETSDGVLALRASGVKCPTETGFRITARYQIDGHASTGVFAGARGSGRDTVVLVPGSPGQVTISGKLKLR